MDRHFLITVSDQKSASKGIHFVGDFFSDKTNIKSTLFYSTPKAPLIWESEKNLEAMTRQKNQERRQLEKGEEVLENAAIVLEKKGFPKENVIQKAQTQLFSKVADIIHEGEKGAYDAIILGRRGISMLEEAFEESVSKALFKEKFSFPLWLCNSSDASRKNILLYLDGSAASFQMADHVGFILGQEKKHRVDMIALESILSNQPLMDQYVEALVGNGLDENRIAKRSAILGNPAKEILKITEKEPYAAVALGRSSSEASIFSRLFRGPVCSILFKELKNSALWLCP